MTALDFGLECTDLRHIDLNVINNQKHTYPRFKETLACYPQSIDETLAKYADQRERFITAGELQKHGAAC